MTTPSNNPSTTLSTDPTGADGYGDDPTSRCVQIVVPPLAVASGTFADDTWHQYVLYLSAARG